MILQIRIVSYGLTPLINQPFLTQGQCNSKDKFNFVECTKDPFSDYLQYIVTYCNHLSKHMKIKHDLYTKRSIIPGPGVIKPFFILNSTEPVSLTFHTNENVENSAFL